MTDNKPVEHKVKYGPLTCFYCFKSFIPKKVFGSISLEEQAKVEELFISHLTRHHQKAMLDRDNSLPYQRIK